MTPIPPIEPPHASPLELFFDLAFVLGAAQVAATLHENLTAEGLAHTAATLVMLWWAWHQFTWKPVGARRSTTLMLLGIAAMVAMAATVPSAFAEGGIVFGLGFVVLGVISLIESWRHTAGNHAHRLTLSKSWLWWLIAPTIVAFGSLLTGPMRVQAWMIAIVADVVAAAAIKETPWRERPPAFETRRRVIASLPFVLLAIATLTTLTDQAPGLELGLVLLAGLIGIIVLWWVHYDAIQDDREAPVASMPTEDTADAPAG